MLLRVLIIAQVILGFFLGVWCSFFSKPFFSRTIWRNSCHRPSQSVRYQELSRETNAKSLVLVAVMTHFGTIKTRAVAIHKTWGQDIPGKVIFFVGNTGNKTEVDLPLVVLPVADDVYPPQKKAMLMLKHVYEHYGDSFRWFIRADDDVYFNSDNLGALLISLTDGDDVLLGHAGIGTSEEKGKLGLEEQSNFCIGGTGIVINRSVLKKVYPHLDHCIKNTATTHEDSEVGRCLRKFVGVQCPWGYEASEIFLQDYGDDGQAYHGDLDMIPLEKIVSLHPVKDARYLIRLHHHFLSIKQREMQNEARKLKKHLKNTEKILTMSENDENFFRKHSEYFCHLEQCGEFHTPEESAHSKNLPPKTWAMFQDLQSFGVRQFSSPVERIQSSKAKILELVTEKAKLSIIQEEKPKLYHGFYFGKWTVGYTRESPIRGNLYEVQYTVRMKRLIDGELKSFRELRRVKFKNSYGSLISRVQHAKPGNELVNIILPVKGPVSRFEDFLKHIHQMLVKFNEFFSIFVVFFRQVASPVKKYRNIFDNYRKKFGNIKFVWLEVDGKFIQETVLNATLKHFPKSQLLLFTEVDFIISADFLAHCRQNTEKGRIYFPLALKTRDKRNAYQTGRWEFQNYTTFCADSDDVHPVANASSESGSSETSSLVDLFIAREQRVFDVFRAPDPGLLMVDTSRPTCLTKDNKACMDRFDSKETLFDYLFKKDYLKDFL